MVKSDGKLMSVNFYQTEKIRLSRRTTRRKKPRKRKTDLEGRFSCGIEVRFHRNYRLDIR